MNNTISRSIVFDREIYNLLQKQAKASGTTVSLLLEELAKQHINHKTK